ncbi:MAG: hypothetical protein HQ463_05375 [Bacteroidetes bacterium]|nr:hypothetical protein [Bacteroidota bacterium]
MKQKLKTIVMGIILSLTNLLVGQSTTDIELHNRYWTYRENFRKYFSVISKEPGGGLPFSDLKTNHSPYFNVVDAQGNNISGNVDLAGQINVGGDVIAFMAEYMGVLASEYWLLHNGGKASSLEEKAVLNEIYFALYAMERLDKYAKKYFNPLGTADTDADGFFVREDAPLNVYEKLVSNNYPEVKWMSGIANQGRPLNTQLSDLDNRKFIANVVDENGNPAYVKLQSDKSDFIGVFRSAEKEPSYLNEMSQDQLIGVLFGFKCIVKFVDPYVDVDPDGANTALANKNIHDWVKYLTDKMMLHLTKTTYDVPMFTQEEINAKKIKLCDDMNEKPWTFGALRFKTKAECENQFSVGCQEDRCTNFVTDTEEPNNPKIAAHANYVITNPHNGGKEVSRGPFAYIFGYPLEKLGEDITGNDYPDVDVKLSLGASLLLNNGLSEIITNLTSYSLLGKSFDTRDADWWKEVYLYIPKTKPVRESIKGATGASMHIWLGAASGAWPHNHYYDMMVEFDRPEADLFYSVLNDKIKMVSNTLI